MSKKNTSCALVPRGADATTLLQHVQQQATQHPYRTIGVAVFAGLALSTRAGRTLAGWAALRMGWDLLFEVLRDKSEASPSAQ